jgi:hypothetical protein
MKRRLIGLLGVLLALGFILVGCAIESDDSDGSGSSYLGETFTLTGKLSKATWKSTTIGNLPHDITDTPVTCNGG